MQVRSALVQSSSTHHRLVATASTAAGASASSSSSSQAFIDLIMVWQQLSNRLPSAKEGRLEAALLLKAVKLAMAGLRLAPLLPDGRVPVQRAIALAMLLADLAASGVPVDGVSIAAAVVADGVASGHIPMVAVHQQLGMEVRALRRLNCGRDSETILEKF